MDLAIKKTADDKEVTAGDPIGFTIEVENIGEGIALGVVIDDILPAGFSWDVDPDDSNCNMLNVHLTCDAGNLGPGDTYSVHVVAETTPEDCGTVENTATVAFDDDGADLTLFTVGPNDPQENNSDTATIFVQCPAIEIEKTATLDGTTEIFKANVGDTIQYNYVVTNTGNVTLNPVSFTDDGGTPGDISDDTTFTVFTDLDPGESTPVNSIFHLVTANDAAAGSIHNIVVATGTPPSGPDVTAEDDATVTITAPNLAITKTADAAEVDSGDEIEFTISVTNNGTGVAHNVTVTDILLASPPGLSWSDDSSDCSIAGVPATLTCTFGDLAVNQTKSVHIESDTHDETCGTVSNKATVTSSNATKEASASILVNCPDLHVIKVADAEDVSAGDQIGFKITITNKGEGLAKNVKVDDATPNGFDWKMDPPVDGCEFNAEGNLHCDFDAGLAPGGEIVIHLVAETTTEDCGEIENEVEVNAANEPEYDEDDNEAEATIDIHCPNVLVEKHAVEEEVLVGDEIGFTIEVQNDGTARAQRRHDRRVAGRLRLGDRSTGRWLFNRCSDKRVDLQIWRHGSREVDRRSHHRHADRKDLRSGGEHGDGDGRQRAVG